jgi:Fe-S cluster biogenesis protein NfuA
MSWLAALCWVWRRAPESALAARVREELREVQRYAESHGGSIALVSVDVDGTVRVRLRGACATCPLASVTLRVGVERRLMRVPGVTRVLTCR